MTKEQRKQRFCAVFEEKMIAKIPALAGKLDWFCVHHYFYSGLSVDAAVDRYASHVEDFARNEREGLGVNADGYRYMDGD